MYMYQQNLALNNLHWLICHKTKPNLGEFILQHSSSSIIQQGKKKKFLFIWKKSKWL